jgi:hypothetical protein
VEQQKYYLNYIYLVQVSAYDIYWINLRIT